MQILYRYQTQEQAESWCLPRWKGDANMPRVTLEEQTSREVETCQDRRLHVPRFQIPALLHNGMPQFPHSATVRVKRTNTWKTQHCRHTEHWAGSAFRTEAMCWGQHLGLWRSKATWPLPFPYLLIFTWWGTSEDTAFTTHPPGLSGRSRRRNTTRGGLAYTVPHASLAGRSSGTEADVEVQRLMPVLQLTLTQTSGLVC